MKANKRRFAIGFYILTGWMPWGTDLNRGDLHRDGGGVSRIDDNYWPICCGHVLRDVEVEAWKAAGLLAAGPARNDRPSVQAGPELERWINDAWHQLQVRSWQA